MKITSLLLLLLSSLILRAENDLEKVIRERDQVLTKLVELTEARHAAGAGSDIEILEARIKLLRFRISVAKNAADRITIQEQIVTLAEENEKNVIRRFESGQGLQIVVLEAKDRTLEEKQILLTLRAAKP